MKNKTKTFRAFRLLDKLNEGGVRVYIKHLRAIEGESELYSAIKKPAGSVIKSHGGRTEITLEGPGFTQTAKAKCSEGDNFCKNTGVLTALDRALEKLKKENPDARNFVSMLLSRPS
jgi:hypothetical protein